MRNLYFKIMKLKHNERAFTIIEVMIVLAIAGLVISLILISSRSLQRINRNTERRHDASFISSERIEYDIDNNTTFPTSPVSATCAPSGTGTFSTLCTYLVNYMSYYRPSDITVINNGTTAPTSIPTVTVDTVVSATYLICDGNTPTVTGARLTDTIVLYALEKGDGGQTNQCIYTAVVKGL